MKHAGILETIGQCFKYCAPKACKVALRSDFVENICNFENFQNVTCAHKSRNALAFMRFPILMVLMRNLCSNHIVLIRNYMGFSSIKRPILRLIYLLTFAAVFSISMKSWFAGTVVRTFCVVTRGVAMTTMMAFHTFVNI